MRIRTNINKTHSSRALNKREVIWGFLLENTLFTEFQDENHTKIEAAYSQRKQRSTSYYIELEDNNLPKPHKARVYFGVARMHLRMPGTRYYVERHVISPPLLSPCSATSLAGSDRSCPSPLPTTPAFMPSPMSTASTTTITTTYSYGSRSSYTDLLCPRLDPSLAALFPEEMTFPVSDSNMSAHNFNMDQQFFTPIGNQTMKNGSLATVFDDSLTTGALNGNENWNHINQGSQVYNNIGTANMNSFSNDLEVPLSLDQNMQYADRTQYKQQQLNAPHAYNFNGPLSTDANYLLEAINWLSDDALCTPTSASNNNNGSISFQELVSWPPLGPSLVPKFDNSCDNENINMTNLYHDLNHFMFR